VRIDPDPSGWCVLVSGPRGPLAAVDGELDLERACASALQVLADRTG
jgi:hypothetical protein